LELGAIGSTVWVQSCIVGAKKVRVPSSEGGR